jgi:DNA-3-methyladenine glycosylase
MSTYFYHRFRQNDQQLEKNSLDQLREILREDVVAGARAMLGYRLVTPIGDAFITETEAYRGSDDAACHAYGKSKMKNMALFAAPGTAYIYLNYGIHWMLNVAALEEGVAAGILIRSAHPIRGFESGIRLDGPGRLGRALAIGPEHNGIDLFSSHSSIHIEPGRLVQDVLVGPRVGIAKSIELPWRFIDESTLLDRSH